MRWDNFPHFWITFLQPLVAWLWTFPRTAVSVGSIYQDQQLTNLIFNIYKLCFKNLAPLLAMFIKLFYNK